MSSVYIKRKIIFIIILITSFTCVGCSRDNKNYSWTQSEQSSIIELSQYEEIQYSPIITTISEEDIKKAIDSKLFSAAEMIIEDTRSNVINGDSVVVDYIVTYQGEVLYINNDVKLTIGEGTFDIDFERSLLSAQKGETVIFDYLVKDKENDLYNKTVQIEAVVTQIYRVEEYVLSDEYVSKHFDIDTVEEFVDSVVISLDKTCDAEDRVRNAYTLLNDVCNNSTFVINKEEFEQTRTFVLSKYRDIANIYDMELSEYVEKILNMNESDFENFCDDEAVTQIQMKLVIEEIAQRENIVISQNELEECAKSKGYTELDLLKFPTLYKDLESELMQDKVYDYLLAHSIKK